MAFLTSFLYFYMIHLLIQRSVASANESKNLSFLPRKQAAKLDSHWPIQADCYFLQCGLWSLIGNNKMDETALIKDKMTSFK